MCMRNYQRKIPLHSIVVQDEGGDDDNDILIGFRMEETLVCLQARVWNSHHGID